MDGHHDMRITIDQGRFMLDGAPIWLNGANTPWHRWNDFGGRFDPVFWDEHFAALRRAGVTATRIWINCGGQVGVLLDEDSMLKSVTDQHWADLDVLFSLARRHGVYIMATLLSFDHFKDNGRGAHHLAWRKLAQRNEAIHAFADGYVTPFVQRYADNPFLFAIDLMNEPDWVHENQECGQLPWEDLSRLFAVCCAAIHRHSQALVTVGIGIVKYNSDRYVANMVSDERLTRLAGTAQACLDFYSPHYYHWEKKQVGSPFEQTPAAFGLDVDRPAVIGECAAVDETGVSLRERYEAAWRRGWQGVFVWTSNGVDACGGYDDMLPATTYMQALLKEAHKTD